jgi:hypothetical protein
LLLQHPLSTIDEVRQLNVPLWVAEAGRDGLVPAVQVQSVVRAGKTVLRGYVVIPDVTHTGIWDSPALLSWLRGTLPQN